MARSKCAMSPRTAASMAERALHEPAVESADQIHAALALGQPTGAA